MGHSDDDKKHGHGHGHKYGHHKHGRKGSKDSHSDDDKHNEPHHGHTTGGGGSHSWYSGLLGCTENPKNVVEVCCCPHCMINRQWSALQGEPDKPLGVMCCASAIGFFMLINCKLRCDVAAHYNIEESCCMSCCQAWICPLCSLCQTWRELQDRGCNPGGWCSLAEAPNAPSMK